MWALIRQKMEEAIAVQKADGANFDDLYNVYVDIEIEYLQTLTDDELRELARDMKLPIPRS